jgi:hypothetical protein
VIADGTRLARTQRDLADLLGSIAGIPQGSLQELKSTEIYRGRRQWNGVPGDVRHGVIDRLVDWIGERHHRLTLAAIEYERMKDSPGGGMDCWLAAALHTALQVQRAGQRLPSNKGVTFLVFDEQKHKADALSDLLFDPPAWTDLYYDRNPRRDQLDQVIDSAFYAKSHHAGLIQIADLFAFIFRRHAELVDRNDAESYPGEADRIRGWAEALATQLLDRAHRWPARPGNDAARWFNAVAPPALLELH